MKTKKQQKPAISQSDLETIESLRRAKARLTSTLKEIEADLAQREREVVDGLKAGGACTPGPLYAVVETRNVCNPSYKDELIAHFEQSHGIDAKLVEQQVQARWAKTKEVVVVVHRPTVKAVH